MNFVKLCEWEKPQRKKSRFKYWFEKIIKNDIKIDIKMDLKLKVWKKLWKININIVVIWKGKYINIYLKTNIKIKYENKR